jgi:hypothetical protein
MDKILDTNIREPEATQVWEWFKKNGFDHPDAFEKLDELFFTRGVLKYYKELIELVNSKSLNDKISAHIINLLGGVYEGKGENSNEKMYIAKNEKDKAIQELILSQIENPKGKESLYTALDLMSYATDKKEVQVTLDNMLKNDKSLLDDIEIYKLKVSHSIFDDDGGYSKIDTIEKISTLPKNKQNKLIPEIIDSFDVIFFGDNETRKQINNLLKNNPPTIPKSININKIEEEFQEHLEVPKTITDLDEVTTFIENEHEVFLAKKREEISQSIEEYGKWVRAYAETSDIDNKYEFYKEQILKAKTIEEKAAIITMISNESDNRSEYNDYLEKLYDDYDLKETIENCNQFWKKQ